MVNDKPQTLRREPCPDDWCSYHQTHAEDRTEDADIGAFWQRLGAGWKIID